MDLTGFYAAYRRDGHGRAAHQRPDHCTIARFRQRHEAALAGLFGDVLALCADAGLVGVAVLAVDGTKVHANASQHQNLDYDRIAREILAEADAVDRAEDERFGDRRGDELPPELSTAQGRRGWLREAKRRLDEKRAAEAKPIPRSRAERLREGRRRLEEDHEVHCRANEAYEAYRARGVMKDGRRFGMPPTPYTPSATPAGKVNVSDPDSRNVKTPRGYMQGYNAQGVCNEHQIVVAAELSADSPDVGHLEPMVAAAERELTAAGVTQTPRMVVADAGYLASRPDRQPRRPRHHRLDPARCRQAQGRAAGLGRRPLRVHAPGALNRPRQGALRQAAGDDRAGLRPHQVQPPHRPLLTPRHIGMPVGMAPDHRDPQPSQAPPPPNRRRPRLTAPRDADRARRLHRRPRQDRRPPRRLSNSLPPMQQHHSTQRRCGKWRGVFFKLDYVACKLQGLFEEESPETEDLDKEAAHKKKE